MSQSETKQLIWDGRRVVAAGPAKAEGGPPPATGPALLARAAAWLEAREVGADVLLSLALGFAAVAFLALVLAHPGVGGILGLVAFAAGELSLASPAGRREAVPARVQGLNPLVDLLLVAGLAGGISGSEPPIVLVLSLLVLVLFAWLPFARQVAGLRMPSSSGLWRRTDRVLVLLVAIFKGTLWPALLMLVLVGALDAWLRAERLGNPPGFETEIELPHVRRFLRPDGSFLPVARWTTLAVTLLLVLLLPQSAAWRF